MLRKGNIGYLRHYRERFSPVIQCYLPRSSTRRASQEGIDLRSLSKWRSRYLSVISSPVLLDRQLRREPTTSVLCADLVFGWWSWVALRLRGWPLVVAPVTLPEEIYRVSGRSLSGLPIPLERLMIDWTLRRADAVVIGVNADVQEQWLRSRGVPLEKLARLDITVDELPHPILSTKHEGKRPEITPPVCLLYVGRLHPEKQTDDLAEVAGHLRDMGIHGLLTVLGDGPGVESLRAAARTLGVLDRICIRGYASPPEVHEELTRAHVFLSPRTGTALREAAFAGLPIVAYETDWVTGVFENEVNAILVPDGDAGAMALAVARIYEQPKVAQQLREGALRLAGAKWNLDRLPGSLKRLEWLTRRR